MMNNTNRQLLSIREIQLAELSIFKKISSICEREGLRYYVYGGTLLGAIRHKGFIPWDDDMDLIMPRPDYEKLISLSKNMGPNIGNLQIRAPELNPDCDFPFIKVCDTSIKLSSASKIDNALWIDIFPVDGMKNHPEKHLKRIALYKRVFKAKRLQERKIKAKKPASFREQIIKAPLNFVLHFVSYNYLLKRFVSKCKKQPYSTSEYVCDTVWAKHPGNILKREWLEKTIKMPFEDIEVNVFGGYEYYLENRYGKDYMKVPPKNKRETHHIKAYRIDKKANI